MDISRWSGRVAVVTGASAGIGASIVVELSKHGIKTIGLARRVERVEDLKNQLKPDEQKNLIAMKCDVSKEEEIVKVFSEIVQKFGGIDILINNAGILRPGNTTDEGSSEMCREVIETNLMAPVHCTREAVKSMKARNSEGYIIHINSIAGHFHPYRADSPAYGIYASSKFGLTALAEQHRHEFTRQKLNIKVTVSVIVLSIYLKSFIKIIILCFKSLSPGAVKSEIMLTLDPTFSKEALEEMFKSFPLLNPKDIADAIIYLLSNPPHVNVCELTIRPLHEEF
jgi:NADP+-dependent farnesol dehydrogenase